MDIYRKNKTVLMTTFKKHFHLLIANFLADKMISKANTF